MLVATLTCLLASGAAVVFVPALLGRLVDAVRGGRGVSAVDLIAVGLLVALLTRAVFTGLGHLLLARLGEQVLARLRDGWFGGLWTPLRPSNGPGRATSCNAPAATSR